MVLEAASADRLLHVSFVGHKSSISSVSPLWEGWAALGAGGSFGCPQAPQMWPGLDIKERPTASQIDFRPFVT